MNSGLSLRNGPHGREGLRGWGVIVPTAELRKLGAQAAFLDALDEAHRRGWYDK